MKKNVIVTEKTTLLHWLNYIEKFKLKNYCSNLSNVKKIAKKIKLLPISSYIFLVGGTNGKGSVCFALEKILLLSGFTVGLYTSPHLICYKERIRVNGSTLSDSEHVRVFNLIELSRKNLELNYFEYITLMALSILKQKKLDILILEVGLGGKCDPTNIVEPNVSIVTNIGLDHTEVLGKNLKCIAKEKFGIFRKKKLEF